MKIGDELYKYHGMGKLATYKVLAVIERELLMQYELECQNCEHGFNCRILVVKHQHRDTYLFVGMVNDDSGEYNCWHTTYEHHEEFFKSKDCAKHAIYNKNIQYLESEVQKHKDNLATAEKRLVEIQNHYEMLDKVEAK